MTPGDGSRYVRPQTLNRLTGIRGLAALLVFLYHAARHTEWVPQERWVHLGFTGVAFFFVLSGFVLTWTARPTLHVGDFYLRRFARVYPSHFAVALVALTLPVLAYPITGLAVATNFTLTQSWFVPWDVVFGLNAVSWSLSCEMAFYLAAPFVITRLRTLSLRGAALRVGVWYALTQAAAIIAGIHSNGTDVWAYTNPAIRSGEFAIGIILALAVRNGWRYTMPLWVPVGAAGATWVAVTLWAPGLPQSVANVLLTPCFAAIIVAAATADIRGCRGPAGSRIAVYLGEVSFAFYLVHELVLLNTAPVLGAGHGGLNGLIFLGAALLMSFALAAILHHLVERPVQRLLTRGRRETVTAR